MNFKSFLNQVRTYSKKATFSAQFCFFNIFIFSLSQFFYSSYFPLDHRIALNLQPHKELLKFSWIMPPIQSRSSNLLHCKVHLFNLIAHILVHFHSLLFYSQLSALAANVIIKIYRVTAAPFQVHGLCFSSSLFNEERIIYSFSWRLSTDIKRNFSSKTMSSLQSPKFPTVSKTYITFLLVMFIFNLFFAHAQTERKSRKKDRRAAWRKTNINSI